jgi:ribonuclease III
MQTIEEILRNAPSIEEKLHYSFKDRSLLVLAFIHRSYVNEHKEIDQHNERLEFLGDSVLGLLISEHLYRTLPDTPEGDLSFLRSRLIEASSCVTFVHKCQIESYLLLGRGEQMNDGRGRDSILADLFEAVIGAIFLDGGLEAAKRFLFDNFAAEITATLKTPISNWKAQLQDYCQKKYQQAPIYQVISATGPDHQKHYKISVWMGEQQLGCGEGGSKKAAQQEAAANAMARLKE